MTKLTQHLVAWLATLGIGLAGGAALAAAANPASVPASVPTVTGNNLCEELATPNLRDGHHQHVDFARIPDAPSHLVSAKLVEAVGDVPAYCHASGYVAPAIGFELRLPVSNWNGKFAMVGCGGMCGGVQAPGCDSALVKGYA